MFVSLDVIYYLHGFIFMHGTGNLFSRLSRRALRSGQSLAEYALLLSFVSTLTVVLMTIFTSHFSGLYSAIEVALNALRAAI